MTNPLVEGSRIDSRPVLKRLNRFTKRLGEVISEEAIQMSLVCLFIYVIPLFL